MIKQMYIYASEIVHSHIKYDVFLAMDSFILTISQIKMDMFAKHKCTRWQQSPNLLSFRVSINITRSLTLVSFERVSLVEYAS